MGNNTSGINIRTEYNPNEIPANALTVHLSVDELLNITGDFTKHRIVKNNGIIDVEGTGNTVTIDNNFGAVLVRGQGNNITIERNCNPSATLDAEPSNRITVKSVDSP